MRRQSALTLMEVLILVVAAIALGIFMLTALLLHAHTRRINNCRNNLKQIGMAIAAYTASSEYYPFSRGPADLPSSSPGTPLPPPGTYDARVTYDCQASIACLYPGYLTNDKLFACPAGNDDARWVSCPSSPAATMGTYFGGYGFSAAASGWTDPKQWRTQRNFQLQYWSNHKASGQYGYDCRIKPSMVSTHVILADMDGGRARDPKYGFQNHRNGFNFLRADNSCSWSENKNTGLSSDPNDNIFTEVGATAADLTFGGRGPATTGERAYTPEVAGSWSADTDSYVSDNTPPWQPLDPSPRIWLTRSYYGYPDLHAP